MRRNVKRIAVAAPAASFFKMGNAGGWVTSAPADKGSDAGNLSNLALVVLCTSDRRSPEYPEHYALIKDFVTPSAVGSQGPPRVARVPRRQTTEGTRWLTRAEKHRTGLK